MKILFLGDDNKIGYSYYQYKILKKNYKNIKKINIKTINFCCVLINKINWHFNFKVFDFLILYFLKKNIKQNYDLIYINNENLLGEKSISYLKKNRKKLFIFVLTIHLKIMMEKDGI